MKLDVNVPKKKVRFVSPGYLTIVFVTYVFKTLNI